MVFLFGVIPYSRVCFSEEKTFVFEIIYLNIFGKGIVIFQFSSLFVFIFLLLCNFQNGCLQRHVSGHIPDCAVCSRAIVEIDASHSCRPNMFGTINWWIWLCPCHWQRWMHRNSVAQCTFVHRTILSVSNQNFTRNRAYKMQNATRRSLTCIRIGFLSAIVYYMCFRSPRRLLGMHLFHSTHAIVSLAHVITERANIIMIVAMNVASRAIRSSMTAATAISFHRSSHVVNGFFLFVSFVCYHIYINNEK